MRIIILKQNKIDEMRLFSINCIFFGGGVGLWDLIVIFGKCSSEKHLTIFSKWNRTC